jgi:hypothetical protein
MRLGGEDTMSICSQGEVVFIGSGPSPLHTGPDSPQSEPYSGQLPATWGQLPPTSGRLSRVWEHCPGIRPDCPRIDPRARAHGAVVPETVPVVPGLGAVVPGHVPIAPVCVPVVRRHRAIVPDIVPVVPRPAVLSRHPRFLSLVRFRLSESRSQMSHVAGQCAGNWSQCLRTCRRQVFSPKNGLGHDACSPSPEWKSIHHCPGRWRLP